MAHARDAAEIVRNQIGAGLDPATERQRTVSQNFLDVANLVGVELAKTWKSPKSYQQWQRSVEVHCVKLHNKPIQSITDADCRAIVIPVWEKTPETGRRLRHRLERIFDYASAHGWCDGVNPARWAGHFKEVMVSDRNSRKANFPAMPYNEVPEFVAQLRQQETVAALGLEFLILTATRSSETLNAQWSEIDFETSTWRIGSERMKSGRPHDIPLTDQGVEILKKLYKLRQHEYVFLGKRPKRPLSNMTFTMLMRRMGFGHYVPHGFRASFRTWCGNETNTPREVAEAALSHRTGDATELAYSRGNALEKRRRLMPKWEAHCLGLEQADVVQLHA